MEENLHKTMHMSIGWKWDISFIFASWTALKDDTFLIIIGLVLTLLTSTCSIALPTLKNKIIARLFRKRGDSALLIKQRQSDQTQNTDRGTELTERTKPKELIFNFIYMFVCSIFHIATMMLIMTYNGYVVIAVILGLALGFALFGTDKDKDKDIPVNCCAA